MKLVLFLFISIIILKNAYVSCVRSHYIYGGKPATKGQFPFIVSLQVNSSEYYHRCGGSILNSRWVITAGHCWGTLIVVGTIDWTNHEQSYGIEKFIKPNVTFKTDIALMKTDREIQFNDVVQPIDFHGEFTRPNEVATVIGWGLTENGSTTQLMYVDLKIISNEDCKREWPNISFNNICSTAPKGRGTCLGDSGGPLVVKGKLVGIVIYGKPCALGVPDVYERVSTYKDFIEDTIEKCTRANL